MEFINDKSGKTLLFSSLPHRDGMCFVVGYINNFETRQSSAKTNYHWQIFKCRQLIFTEPEILASPVIGKELAVYIVMTEEFYKSSKLQTHLEKLNMNSSSPEPVTNLIYEACFRYTLIARISPLWNQIDNCLVQGRDFLINASFMNAIKFEMIIRDESMFLSVWPLRVKLPLMKKEHLDLNQNSCDQYVHALPRMKKCYLRSISSDIPMTCPYKSYKELKRHWKNMYGYRLPEDTDQVFYCSVSFSGFGSNLYTYPSVCVRRNNLLFLRHTDHMDILQNFLADINKKFPNVCGKPFGTDSRVMYAVPKLCSWSESLGEANLSTEPVHQLPADQFKYLPSVEKIGEMENLSEDTSANDVALSPTCDSAPSVSLYSDRENLLKQQSKLVPIFRPQLCSTILPQPTNFMGDVRPLTTGTFSAFQQLAYVNPASALLQKDVGKKKPRSRPQVQPDVDVEQLARNRDLARVNTATLVNWLRSKHIPCRVKDRKSDLVDKVMEHLNLSP